MPLYADVKLLANVIRVANRIGKDSKIYRLITALVRIFY